MPQNGNNSFDAAAIRCDALLERTVVLELPRAEDGLSVQSSNALKPPVLYPSGTDFRMRIPTLRRLDWTPFGSAGERVEFCERPEDDDDVYEEEPKKEVMCRWAGSAAAPANMRLFRGADMMMVIASRFNYLLFVGCELG